MAQPFYFVAVHGGAGNHHKTGDGAVKAALKLACRQSLRILETERSSVDAVEQAIVFLEHDECLNAGYGSNLTLDGAVECDASIMDGSTSAFGAIGAASGIRNPIKAARAVLEHSSKPDPLGRIPPILLVSRGAVNFAKAHGLELVHPKALITPRASAEWDYWRSVLESATNGSSSGQTSSSSPVPERFISEPADLHAMQDTVGAVAWDISGRLSAGVSSGGLLLKPPGRIGEAAVYGAGCWAKTLSAGSVDSMACSVSGAGEDIIRGMLARSIGDAMDRSDDPDIHEILQNSLTKALDVIRQGDTGALHAGVLLLVREKLEQDSFKCRLWCAFTTNSMAVAYASSLHPEPKARIVRRTSQLRDGHAQVCIVVLPVD